MALYSKKEQELMEAALRAREKEVKGLESKVLQLEDTLQNINRILDQQDRATAALTNLQHLYSRSTNVREVAGAFVELAIKAARCEAAVLVMREGAHAHFSVLAAIGDRQELVRSLLFNEGEGILGEVVRSGDPLLVPDGRREPRLRQEGPDWIQRDPRNALCIPVTGQTRVWGALLLVNSVDRKRFSKQDIDLLTIFTMRLARELEREHEFARVREEATRFSTLLRVTELLHVATDRQKVQDLLVQLACRLARAAGAAVFELDESQQVLNCRAASERQLRPVQVLLGAGVAGWVALEGQPVSAVVEGDPRFGGQVDPVFTFRVDTVLAVPIRGANRVLGVLEVANKQGAKAFDAADLSLVTLLAREGGIALDHLGRTQANERTIMELLRGIARSLDAKAPHLLGHSERVAKISQTLAEELSLSPDEVHEAYLAGLLHDLGNIGVDDELFLAARKLTADETARMRSHTSIGAEVLREVGTLRHLMVGPLYHHERWDGDGYPQGLKGEAIPLVARIVGVAEAFDAVRSPRPYRPALPLAEALAHIRGGEGTMFDPRVVGSLIAAYQRGKLPA